MRDDIVFVDWLLLNARPKSLSDATLWEFRGGLFTSDELMKVYESMFQIKTKLN